MAWKFIGDQRGLEPLPGIPLLATDREFKAAVDIYEAQLEDRLVRNEDGDVVETVKARGSVKRSGLYEQFDDPKPLEE